ncbi:MAG: hypothetical protein IPN34_27465 [Planctomycetes bacterium]|nr:hypothetical protein [Planctomycetota bacterium]
MQFTTDWIRPTRVAQDDSVGTTAWVETDAIFTGDTYTFSFFNAGAETAYLDQARLVFNDAITGANEASGTDTSPFANLGGVSDLWGESSLAGSDINNLKFGVAIATGTANSGVPSGTPESYYLIATGYEGLYAIPDDATIDGIEVQLDGGMEASGGGTTTYRLYEFFIRVTYTWNPKINAVASSYGNVVVPTPPNRQLPQKKYRAKVRSEAGDYLGDWRDLANKPTYKQDINNLIGSMPIAFSRNYLSTETAVDTLLNEDDTVLTDENDSPFLIDTAPVSALGAGTNLDTNFNVEVDAIYGQFEALLNEDDTPILNEDGSLLLVEEGYPLGRTIFRGYVPRWELPLSGKGITAEIRSYSQDLVHIMLETEDTPYVTNSTLNGGFYGINGGGPTDHYGLYQSFTMAAEKKLSKVRLYPFAGWYTDVPFSVTIRGGTPSSPTGISYGGGEGIVNRNTPVEYYDVVFDTLITLPAGTYYFDFATDFAKTGGNVTYPFNLNTSSAFGGGSLWYITNDTGLVNDTGSDIAFILYEAGAETTVPYLSEDPSDILRSIIDFARGRGAQINYTSDSIQDTGTTVSYTFRGQTIKEAIEKVLELAPANWYFYYDFGTDTLYFKERSATPDRWLRPDSIVDGKIIKTIEQVINDVPFSGGGDPALYVRDTVAPASGTRRGLKKLSDNRVTTEATAYILTGSEIDQFNQALYAGDVEITEDGTFYLEDVAVGEMLGFIGLGSLVDAIVVQSVSKDYKPESMPLTLTYNVPRVNKRVEDIKRNLDALETANNPTEPS